MREKVVYLKSIIFKAARWPKRHKKIVAGVLGIVIIAIAAWFAYQSLSPDKIPVDNPVANQYREKLPALKKDAQDNASDATAQRQYAIALYATGDIKSAKTYYEKAVKLSGNDATLHNNLGNTYRDLGDIDKAIAAYRKAIELSPKLLNPYVNLASVQLYSQNKADDAIATYKDALKAMPGNDQIQLLLGLAYEKKGDKTAAKQTYESILANDPDNAGARANLDRLNKN